MRGDCGVSEVDGRTRGDRDQKKEVGGRKNLAKSGLVLEN